MTNDNDALRDAILKELAAAMPPQPLPGDFTKQQYMQATGLTRPTADYRLNNLVRDGVLETMECTIDGHITRIWRKRS